MDLEKYGAIVLKWWWLNVLGTLLVGGVAFAVNFNTAPIYQASTTLMVNQGSNPALSDYTEILIGQQLAKTYVELMKKRPVLVKVIENLQLPMSPEQLAVNADAQLVRDTQLIMLRVEDENPALAARLADEIARVFIEQNQANQFNRFARSKENLQKELKQQDADMASTQVALTKARAASNAAEVVRLEANLSQANYSYSSLLKTYQDLRVAEALAVNNLIIVETAQIPNIPVRPNVMTNTLLGAVVGLMLMIGIIFLIEYLDDRINSPERVDLMLHLPTIGTITRMPARTAEGYLIVEKKPPSPLSETYRALRTKIQFANVNQPVRTILITSAEPLEGKSTIAANLAVAFAQGGFSVALVDANWRKPILHHVFKTPNDQGLFKVFLDQTYNLNESMQKTKVERLALLPAGPIPTNPSELLGSKPMAQLIETLKQSYHMVIFDSPPVLEFTDATILAFRMDGVVLVVDSKSTRYKIAKQAIQTLNYTGARILGVVLNKY